MQVMTRTLSLATTPRPRPAKLPTVYADDEVGDHFEDALDDSLESMFESRNGDPTTPRPPFVGLPSDPSNAKLHSESSAPPRRSQPVQRALLIGISYQKIELKRSPLKINTEKTGDEGKGKGKERVEDAPVALVGPHKDVRVLRELLINVYNYKEHDITTMIDSHDVPEDRQPTLANVQEGIRRLVHGAQAGDTFVFHYAGHGFQRDAPTRSSTEVDGFDEYLELLDKPLRDNELRALLVDELPPGANLVAIMDCCHSGSMLDLEHSMCNGVYYPWVSKGVRGTKDKHNVVQRKYGMIPTREASLSSTGSNESSNSLEVPHGTYPNAPGYSDQMTSSEIPLKPRHTDPSPLPTSPSLLMSSLPNVMTAEDEGVLRGRRPFVPQRKNATMSPHVQDTEDTIRPVNFISGSPPKAAALRTTLNIRTTSLDHPEIAIDVDNEMGKQPYRQETIYYSAASSPQPETPLPEFSKVLGQLVKRTASPLSRFCEGRCRKEPQFIEDRELANIICIASCDDSQISWEDKNGRSMTQTLVDILNNNPHPTLEDVMLRVGHAIHLMYCRLHKKSRRYKQHIKEQNLEREKNGLPPVEELLVEMDNFQDPQLSSLKPLDMKSHLILNPAVKFKPKSQEEERPPPPPQALPARVHTSPISDKVRVALFSHLS
ncbi:hypothetical protein BDN72DRAFT_522002 [Pluteus cervinus]|uniref:Uncharacterized protein n=1 Tax=Pluteus cervinus TaxID=181527 RepID=A0ACD3AZ08_9AGAR|nr:hypothetical protein BDN72DRAFT_522002 [Pluteus cervinus]